MADDDATIDNFPAPSKQASGTVDGVPTTATCMNFSDKIMITLSQGGRLVQWIQVPLSAPSMAAVDMALLPGGGGARPGASLLPARHLTPKTLLGAGGEARDTLGQLYAAQIASHLTLRDPADQRALLLGLGLERAEVSGEALFDVLELVQKVL